MILFSQAALIIPVYITALWIWSIFNKNVSVIDIFWSVGFVIVNVFYAFMYGDLTSRKILVRTFVSFGYTPNPKTLYFNSFRIFLSCIV
jgi:steroid 5-alpha reductase family enzyme